MIWNVPCNMLMEYMWCLGFIGAGSNSGYSGAENCLNNAQETGCWCPADILFYSIMRCGIY